MACYKVTPEAKLHITLHGGEGSTKSTAAEGKEIKTKPSKILSNNNYKKRHSTHTIYTIYTLYLVMVILLQLNKTELYKMRMAVCTWQRHITFDTELALRMNNVCFLFFFFCSDSFRGNWMARSAPHAGVWMVALISADALFSFRPAYSPIKEPSSLNWASSSP